MEFSWDFIPGLVPPLAFAVLAILAVGGALGVVTLRRITHSALALAVSFLAVAGLYVLLQSEFLFAVQILVYVGAIMILIIFAIMLTPESQSTQSNPANRQMALAGVVSVVILGMLAWIVGGAAWTAGEAAPAGDVTARLGDVIFNQFMLPFEIASLVLLVAMIGAIVIAREN